MTRWAGIAILQVSLCFLLLLFGCSKSTVPVPNDLMPMLMVDGALYADTGEEISETPPETHGVIQSTSSQTEKPTQNGQSNFGCVGSSYAIYIEEDFIAVEIQDRWYRFDRIRNPLTLERVKELSKKGDALTWDDFAPYDSLDIGSGLYILRYPIDESYYLLVGGFSPEEAPWYILLKKEGSESDIDIRQGDINAFIIPSAPSQPPPRDE